MNNAEQIFNDSNGIIIDKYNNHYQIQFYNENLIQKEKELIQMLKEKYNPEFIAVKYRFKNYSEIKVVFGDNPKTIVEEYGVKFHVDLLDTLNPGLFLDMRDARHNFAKQCRGKELLNLFAYTCSFGVHARINGAVKAVNVDISKKILNRGRENYLLNGIEPQRGEFFCGDSVEYVDWCIKKGKRFGAIVLDPPSFAKNGKKTFSVVKDLQLLFNKAMQILEENGIILLATNYSEWNAEDLKRIASQSATVIESYDSKESTMSYIICKKTFNPPL